MLYFNNSKMSCSGCAACTFVCPVNCITMMKDNEGFLYPKASEKCISCGQCESVCPIVKKPQSEINNIQSAFMAVSKDRAIWRRSTSGGAFSEICHVWGEFKQGSIFIGAVWNGISVEHICVEGSNNISPLCKSKYVASNITGIYEKIEHYLNENRKVVFCGTPCQVAGVRKIFGTKNPNLLLVDFICHGVGSPDIFETCVSIVGNQFSGQVSAYEFRAKRKIYEQDYLVRLSMSTGENIFIE